MKIAVLTAVHEKPVEVWEASLKSLQALQPDQLVVVHDRASQALRDVTAAIPGAVAINLEGRPGWRSPCLSYNAGLQAVDADIVLLSPSDIIQSPGNLDIVRQHFATTPQSVLFGKVVESKPEICKGVGHAGPVLQGSTCTRPMTFLTAYTAAALRTIGGWDELFQDGVCYEDDDLTARLWTLGLDFVFDDRLSGIHQSHERAFSGNNGSQGYWTDYRVGINRSHMVNRHGRESAINVVMQTKPQILTEPGRVSWKHV